ncbi:MAG: YybH family protein, partial [Alphaproteobacteria bacterium]
WFRELAERVQTVDFAGARHLFAEDMIAFGTFSDFVVGREAVEGQQWRNVWPFIADFRWRLDEVKAMVAADRLSATGMACFDSTGFARDGEPYERPGRATVAFRRAAVGEPWQAQHTHMSLFRGVPQQSFGRKR